jgi:hypothetical protein
LSYEIALKNRKEELVIIENALEKAKEEGNEEKIQFLNKQIEFLNDTIKDLEDKINEEQKR